MLLISRLSAAMSSNNKRSCCCIRPRAGAVVVVAVGCLFLLLLAPADLEVVMVVAVARLLDLDRKGLFTLDREVVGGLMGGCLVVVPGPVVMGAVVISTSASSIACWIRSSGGAGGVCLVLVPTPVVVGDLTGGATCRGGGSQMRGISGSTG